ncbi:MAG: septum formation protein Maf [Anaerolineae bacterium]|nr:MAG: Maf-like protein [Chloroflexi bacterium OLB13]MBC6954781.1 septum formation protein Maf [Chloroflexota bacterium]MCO6444403.1 septum formation protein Maf [Anaerolineae bacterium]MDL1915934.1 septum formation protein Maf [Anaerolineae bacterium CFX4]MEB2365951.1 Maf family protein [Chloroflexota bacterium]
MRLILASSSPRRRDLIASLGIPFTVVRPDINEDIRPDESPIAYVERLSREKAAAVAASLGEPDVVLAADTIVLAADTAGATGDGALLGKPADAAEARAMLRLLREHPHTVHTAFALMRGGGSGPIYAERVETRVTMRPYSDAEIDAYIATGDPFDKAGGYAIQHNGFSPVARIDGCYTNVVGLPLCAVKRALAQAGFAVDAPARCDCAVFTLS